MDVTVVIATYGDDAWQLLAVDRAMPSVIDQVPHIVLEHGDTLHDARNAGLAKVRTEWVIHLDADDELAPDYVAQMAQGTADVRAPSVAYVQRGRRHRPRVGKVAGHTHVCDADCLRDGNWIVVGACVRTQLVRDVGGWEPFEWSEDWALWSRCQRAGASFEALPAAVYVAHVRPDSRNRAPDRAAKSSAHAAIYDAVWA